MAQEPIARVTLVEYPCRGRAHDHLLSNSGVVSTSWKWAPGRNSISSHRTLYFLALAINKSVAHTNKQRHLLCCLFVYKIHILLDLCYVKQSFYPYLLMLCSRQTWLCLKVASIYLLDAALVLLILCSPT